MTPGILPFALRVRLRRFKIAPGDFVSLHAGVAARADQRQKLERLCRYISRPAIAEQRLSLTPNGNVRYDVNRITSVACAWMRRSDPAEDAVPRWHDARHLTPGILPSALRVSLRLFKIAPGDFVEPLDFTVPVRLAEVVPKPRVNLTRLDARQPWRAPAGALRASKFAPGEFVTGCLRQTASTARG